MKKALQSCVHSLLRRNRALAVLGTAAAWLVLGAAAAHAMSVGAGNDPVESVPTQIVATGTASDYYSLVVTEKPLGGQGCAANAEADTGSRVINYDVSPGPYSQSVNWTPDTAGSYLVCGWLEDGITGAVVDHGSAAFSVRKPRLSISLGAPATVRPHQIFQITTMAQAEAERGLDEYLIPNTGDGCPANSAAAGATSNSITADFNTWSVDGGPSTQSYNQSLDRVGSWLICAYFQYQNNSDPPEAVGSAGLKVAYPTPPCVVPQVGWHASVGSIERRIRAAHCSVGRITRAYSGSVPFGDGIAVSPRAGTHLTSYAAVGVVMSAGSKPRPKREGRHLNRRH